MANRAGIHKVVKVMNTRLDRQVGATINLGIKYHIMAFDLCPNSNGKHLEGFTHDHIFILQRSLGHRGAIKGF